MKEKIPPVLSDELLDIFVERMAWELSLDETQCSHARQIISDLFDEIEPLIQQAKAEVAREIFEEIEAEVFDVNDETRRLNLMVINENAAYEWWQSLKDRFLKV